MLLGRGYAYISQSFFIIWNLSLSTPPITVGQSTGWCHNVYWWQQWMLTYSTNVKNHLMYEENNGLQLMKSMFIIAPLNWNLKLCIWNKSSNILGPHWPKQNQKLKLEFGMQESNQSTGDSDGSIPAQLLLWVPSCHKSWAGWNSGRQQSLSNQIGRLGMGMIKWKQWQERLNRIQRLSMLKGWEPFLFTQLKQTSWNLFCIAAYYNYWRQWQCLYRL